MRIKQVLFLPFLIIFLFSSCNFVFPGQKNHEIPLISEDIVKKYSGDYVKNWQYIRLDSLLQSGYREIYAALMENFNEDMDVTIKDQEDIPRDYNGIKIRLSQPLRTQEQANQLYTAVIWDNPQFFYINNTYSCEGQILGNERYYDVFCLAFTMNAEERDTADKKLKKAVRDIVDPARSRVRGHEQFWLQLELHDALLNSCTYDTSVIESDFSDIYASAYTAYGALVDGKAVCEGYARAMQLLLHDADIDCTLVSGTDLRSGISHMWNYVTVDRYNYHLDPTWNDDNDKIHHAYFNITTENIKRDHTIDDKNLGINTCTAVVSQYYRKTGQFLDSSKSNNVADKIAELVQQGQTVIDLQFSSDAYQKALSFIRSDRLTASVNKSLKNISMFKFDTYSKETLNIVTMYKKQ